MRWGADHAGSNFSLASLTPTTIRAFRSHLLEHRQCAAATVNRRLQALRKFCAFAVQAGLMASNPAEGIQLVRDTGAGRATALSAKQIEVLLDVTGRQQPSLARRDTAILLFLLDTGLRVNELVALRLQDVQFDHPGTQIRVADGRNGASRTIPLEGALRHALCEYLAVRPNIGHEVHLFLSREGGPLSARSVQRIVSGRANAAGLKGVSAQALRRTYASRLLEATGDLALVSKRLGHRNLTTTTRFIGTSTRRQAGKAPAQSIGKP
jgi:site-specific recombinase XerD